MESRLGPALGAAGVTAAPAVRWVPLHAYHVPGARSRSAIPDPGAAPELTPIGQAWCGWSAVDVAAVAHVSDPHEAPLIIDQVQNPVVTDPDPEQARAPR